MVKLDLAEAIHSSNAKIDALGYEIDELQIAAQRLENQADLDRKLLEYAGEHVKKHNLTQAFSDQS